MPELEKFEPERLYLRNDAEQRRPILDQAGEHGLAVLQLGHHRGEGRQGGSSEPALDPDRVQARRSGHGVIVSLDLVSRHRRNPVIVNAVWSRSSGDGQVRPVERSWSSRARPTVVERSRVPSLV